MSENFDIKVKIREELKSSLIFGLQARPPIAHILAYFGYSYEVMHLMQTLSHATRAFFVNADGLQGFLVQFDLITFLEDAEDKGQLEKAKEWQVLQLETIV